MQFIDLLRNREITIIKGETFYEFKNRRTKKENIFYIIFSVLCINYCWSDSSYYHKVNNAGYTVIPMLIGLIFSMLYRNSKKAIEENKQ